MLDRSAGATADVAADAARRPRRGRAHGRTALAGALALCLAVAGPAWAASIERVSVGAGGRQGDGESYAFPPAISADGRFVAFESAATNLVAGDTNGTFDVFVRDRRTGATQRVSVATGGAQAAGDSRAPSISADGRLVAFSSAAADLVAGDANRHPDVFVHDRRTGQTSRVSVRNDGGELKAPSLEPSISTDGRLVAFVNDGDVLLRNRAEGKTARVGVGSGGRANDLSADPAISAGGRYVAFWSRATNLVLGDTNGKDDIFVRDRGAGTTTRVSVGPGGAQADDDSTFLSLSAGGRFVAFMSFATNLVPGDTNGAVDAFVHDRETGRTERVSVGPNGVQGNDDSTQPSISADGRHVAFSSRATNLVVGDGNGQADVFVHDRRTGRTSRVSVGMGGAQADGFSAFPGISADGAHVALVSDATNLAPGDTNGATDVAVHSR